MNTTCALAPLLLLIAPAALSVREDPVVIPFDFVSRFDDGRYGRIVGDLLWAKLQKRGGFVLPESMQDIRDWCQRTRTFPTPDTPLAAMARIVRDEQAGQIAIWGRVERVEGEATDVYDLSIRVADFSSKPPRLIYNRDVRTRSVSEIPHVYIAEALAALDGKPPVQPDAEKRAAKSNPPSSPLNLLAHGDFERGSDAPAGWEPLHPGVTWVRETDGQGKANRFLRFEQDEAVAGGTGVLHYSNPFPIEEGVTYRLRCRWRSSGSTAKVFVKAYDVLPGPSGKERREVYRSQQNLQGPSGQWNELVAEFTPKHPQFTPRFARVMLYAYWPPGTVEWDDLSIERVSPH